MTIENPRRRIITAVGAATIALTAAGTGQAGAVGGPEYGIVPVSGAAREEQTVGTSSARRPLPLESLQQVRGATSSTPVVADDFDWADAGVGAAGVALILVALGGARLVVRRHGSLAHS